jgi:hypothetical protein
MFLVVMFSCFLTLAPADAAIVAKGKPLAEFSADDSKNTESDKVNKDDGKNTENDKVNKDDGKNTENDKPKVSETLITGSRKVKANSEEFHPYAFKLEFTPTFLATVMQEEGNDRHTDVWIFACKEELIDEFMANGKAIGLELKFKGWIKNGDIPNNYLDELTSVWNTDDEVVGAKIQIIDKTKPSWLQKARSSPWFGVLGLVPGVSTAVAVIDTGITMKDTLFK